MEIKNKLISVILPVYNEEFLIKDAILSLLNQKLKSHELELLVIDGNSDDSTKNIIQEIAENDSRVKYLFNKKRITPISFNIGINKSKGKYIAIFGAHSIYQNNYIQICIDNLEKTGSVGCSGRVITVSKNKEEVSMMILWLLKSKLGVSNSSFRTMKNGYVDSIPYPIFKKKIILELGGYNEKLHRNQDNDLNHRIISKGHKLYLTDQTSAMYYVDYNFNKLYNYGFNNGKWNAKTLFINYKAMRIHHFIPALFAIYVFSLPLICYYGFNVIMLKITGVYLIPIFAYFLLTIKETINYGLKSKSINFYKLPFLFFKFHMSYGLGTLRGLIK